MASVEKQQYSQEFLREYKGYVLITVAVVFAILGCAVVALRFYARRITRAPMGGEDYMILVTLVLDLGVCADAIAMVKVAHVGTHIAAIMMMPNGAEIVVRWAQFVTSFEILYVSVIVTAKLSVCIFYLRVFEVERWFKISTYVLMIIQVTWLISIFVATMAQCQPFQKQWHPELPGHCFDRNAYYRYLSLPNIITDFFLLAIPLPMVWKLHLNTPQKIALSGVFLLGSIGFIASCIRFSIFFANDAFGDPTWASNTLITWTVVEPGIILIAACLPLFRPLIVQLFPTFTLSRGSSKPSGTDSSTTITPHSQLASNPHGRFSRLEDPRALDANAEVGCESFAKSGDLEEGKRGAEEIPMNRIAVRHDVRWSLSR